MFLNTTFPRRSFSIPININLYGACRRQTRESHQTSVMQEERSQRGNGICAEGARSLMPTSSVGEDRAILLGFTMMAFSVLMLFVVGITTVKPYIGSCWEEASCVLPQTDILEEWVDCRGVSMVPCLIVTVSVTSSNQSAFLHFDEDSVFLPKECFYLPKCQMDRKVLQDEVQKVKKWVDSQLKNSSLCFSDKKGHSNHVILNRKYTLRRVLSGLLWPCLMLGGGCLLVGLVKLTQCLARLSTDVIVYSAGGRRTSRYTQGKNYRLL
ncbi:calcium-activated potassium channel subunit beta-3 isoform X2 [Girardinichthys multiradiatus]|uniref:calcium-activated potassium channel subunit beta-3 isoform X2 n=1 Tax=Girardinichthys multiradiatus TaxID=208333 RepID=UPI001FAC8342|nr:calcium-activated potassium channel subunit beta-3 isoform X2 [Girardinichthys multiradiatus]